MTSLDDTIAAIATPSGEGGIGIIRLSGPEALRIADRIFYSPGNRKLIHAESHTITYGFVVNPETGQKVDEVLITLMRAPKTYTREDVIEINCHGGRVPLSSVLQLVLKEGARLAGPGEFTRRAFLNGRIDLSQAEAVIDVITAKTEQAGRLALQQLEGGLSGRITAFREKATALCAHIEAYIDFPENEIETMAKNEMVFAMRELEAGLTGLSKGYDEGRFFREGASLAIVGKPNVGKSSLLNAMLRKDRAIVTDMPGTTRDVIEDFLNVGGLPLRVMDTAGIRESHDLAEIEGVKRSLKALEGADIVLAVLDAGRPFDEADKEVIERVKDKKTLIVINKADVENPDFILQPSPFNLHPSPFTLHTSIRVSALKGQGIDDLKSLIFSLLVNRAVSGKGSFGSPVEGLLVTNLRHKLSIDNALQALRKASETFERDEPLEVTALFLREALDYLGEIVGAVTTEDILNMIFGEFCIGK